VLTEQKHEENYKKNFVLRYKDQENSQISEIHLEGMYLNGGLKT